MPKAIPESLGSSASSRSECTATLMDVLLLLLVALVVVMVKGVQRD